jgi:hypothetical protein
MVVAGNIGLFLRSHSGGGGTGISGALPVAGDARRMHSCGCGIPSRENNRVVGTYPHRRRKNFVEFQGGDFVDSSFLQESYL